MLRKNDKILSEELVKRGIVSKEDIDKCISEAIAAAEPLSTYLIKMGFATEQQIVDSLASVFNLEAVNLKNIVISKDVTSRVPVKFAWYYKFMPILIKDKTIVLASSSALDVKIIDELRLHLGLEPRVVIALEQDILEAIKQYYGVAADTIDKIMTKDPESKSGAAKEKDVWVEDLEKESEDASVAKLVNQIFLDAYHKRATDIHIEPYRERIRLRYRIDGVLVDAHLPPEAKHFLRPMLSRIKIMANLSIEERRLPQDGSAIVKTKEQDLDLRVSTVPTPRGESMVIRILPTKVMLYSLEKLGLDRGNLKVFRGLVKKPHGIILVTGPTGSGKTTTLYSCLNEINTIQKKIITIEDPVEFEMEGVTQIQVNSKVHLDFAKGLRSVLRHDPDIIMVGEVRDAETAEIAIRTALTGHLVFSTLHTNDSASGITRLVDMGLEPFLVSSSVEAFVAQRLVRVICPSCREEVKTPLLELREEIASSLSLKTGDDVKIFRGKGCDRCNRTGFLGRIAIYEILMVNDSIRRAILDRKRSEEIKIIAMKNGMRTLRQDGWLKVIAGTTTPEEVLESTVKDTVEINQEEPSEEKKEMRKAEQTTDVKKMTFNVQEMMSVKNEYDSRVYARAPVKLPLRFQFLKKDEKDPSQVIEEGIQHSTQTRDISAGGIRFVFPSEIQTGTILSVKVQLAEGERSIDCMAKVCRVEENNLVGQYMIVAYYLDISSADRVRVDDFVKKKLEEKKD